MITISIIGFVAITLAVGIGFSGYSLGYSQGQDITSREYESKAQLSSGAIPTIASSDDVRSITGTIISINDREVQFSALTLSGNFLDAPENTTYTAFIDNTTTLEELKTTFPSSSEDNSGLTGFKRETEKRSISDFSEGDSVTAYSEENIKDITSFSASKIEKHTLPSIN